MLNLDIAGQTLVQLSFLPNRNVFLVQKMGQTVMIGVHLDLAA